MRPDLMLEHTADTVSGGRFMFRRGFLGRLTAHWKRRHGPTLPLWPAAFSPFSPSRVLSDFALELQWLSSAKQVKHQGLSRRNLTLNPGSDHSRE